VQMIPALATETVCCSMASCKMFLVLSSTSVRQNKSSGFENDFLSLWVFSDVNSQTHCGTASARGVDASGSNFMNVLEKLGLCSRRVSAKQNVDLSSEATTACELFANTAK
jgi:hypothetical protein